MTDRRGTNHYNNNYGGGSSTSGIQTNSKSRKVVTAEALRRLAVENKNRGAQKKSPLDAEIEKKVTDYLTTLDPKSRAQLSKLQLVKSYEKVCEWKKRNRNRTTPPTPLSEEFLRHDIDPALHQELPEKPPVPPPGFRAAGKFEQHEHELSGSYFESEIFPRCGFSDQEMQKRCISVKEWLHQRGEKIQERDRLRKWIRNWQQKETEPTSAEELIKMYQKKRREYTVSQWNDIFGMTDNSKLTTNELLRLYRLETMPAKEEILQTTEEPTSEVTACSDSASGHTNPCSSAVPWSSAVDSPSNLESPSSPPHDFNVPSSPKPDKPVSKNLQDKPIK